MQKSSIRTITITVKTWLFKYFTPDKFLLVVVIDGIPKKAIEVG